MSGKLTIKDVVQWVMDNKEDFEALDEVNRLTYTYMRRRTGDDY